MSKRALGVGLMVCLIIQQACHPELPEDAAEVLHTYTGTLGLTDSECADFCARVQTVYDPDLPLWLNQRYVAHIAKDYL